MSDLSRIKTRLLVLRGRIATALALDGSARIATALLAAIAVSFGLDRLFRLEVPARAVLLVAGLGGLAWVTWRFLLRRIRNLPGDDPLAVAVEARFPELKDRLISALQLAREPDPERYGMSPQLIEDTIREAIPPVEKLRFGEVLARGRVMKMTALGALALALLAAGAAADPEAAGIWFQRNVLLKGVRWPQKTYLVIDDDRFQDGVARIVRGADLVVAARSVGEVHPEKVTVFFADTEGDRGRGTMKADLGRHVYRYEFTDVTFPITFHLEGGDDVTRDYRIELLDPPEVTELEVSVGFPPYAGREPVTVDLAAGDPEMLVGGFVSLKGKSSKPLESARLVLGEAEEDALTAKITGPHSFELRLEPTETVLAGVRLRDTDGLSNPSLAPRFLIRVVKDRAPKVRFRKEGVGSMVVAGAVVPYRTRIHDDVKVVEGRIELLKSAGDRQAPKPHVIGLPADQLGSEAVELTGEIELGPFQLNPGAFLALHAFARDNAQPEAHEGKSDTVALKVVTLEELFNDLLRRQQEQRMLFEELIKREKRLRDRFLDLRDDPPSTPDELAVQLESQGQDQREIARRVHAIERAMTQVLDEMYYNRIYDPARILDLRNQVVRALQNLRQKTMANHAALLDEAARGAAALSLGGVDGDGIAEGYARVIRAMEAMLARMHKVEGFTEIVETVRSILKQQGALEEKTRKKFEEVLRDIFGDNPPPKEEEK
ncbi:MAG: hypothetical protein ACYS6Z_02670 [Planctomycetota bacterium]|jgi:hypothetical protein